MKILTVEDDEMRREFVKEVLTDSDHTVMDAPDLETALSLLSNQPFDLYLLDGEFPEGVGGEPRYLAPQLIEEIRKNDSSANITVMSHNSRYKASVEELGTRFEPKSNVSYLFEL